MEGIARNRPEDVARDEAELLAISWPAGKVVPHVVGRLPARRRADQALADLAERRATGKVLDRAVGLMSIAVNHRRTVGLKGRAIKQTNEVRALPETGGNRS